MTVTNRRFKLRLLKRALNSPWSWAVLGIGATAILLNPSWLIVGAILGIETAVVGLLLKAPGLEQKLLEEDHARVDQYLRAQWKQLRDMLSPEDWQRFHKIWLVQKEIKSVASRESRVFLREPLDRIVDQVRQLTQQAATLMRVRADICRAFTQMDKADINRQVADLERRLLDVEDSGARRGYKVALAARREGLAALEQLKRVHEKLEAQLHAIESGLSTIKLRVLLIQSPDMVNETHYDPIGSALNQLIEETGVLEEVVRETSHDILSTPVISFDDVELNGRVG